MTKTMAGLLLVLWMAMPAAAARIELTTEPEFARIEPVHHSGRSPARYRIAVVDEAGRPIPEVRLRYTLHSPPRNAFFSSDFPIVENTILMAGAPVLTDGVLEFDYLTPIRGDYRLVVEAASAAEPAAFAPAHREFTYHVNETSAVVQNGLILFGLLFGIGFVSGYLIARPRTPRAALAMAILTAIVVAANALPARAHQEPAPRLAGSAAAETIVTGGGPAAGDSILLAVTCDPPTATVGRLVTIRGVAMDRDRRPLAPVRFTIRLHHLEDDKDMYATSFVAPAGAFAWQHQFFDGAEHQLIVTAAPVIEGAFAPVTWETTMAVAAIGPPDEVVARTLGFLLLITVAGMACGAVAARFGRRLI